MVVLLLPLVAAILLIDHFFPKASLPEEECNYAFVLTSDPKPTAKCERFEAKVIAVDRHRTNERVYLYVLRDSARLTPAREDTIITHTKVETTNRIGRAFTARYTLLPAKEHKEPLQKRLYGRLNAAGLEGDELATVGALTLGYKDDIDPEVRRHFQASGAAHVLAVSGLHTGIIYGVLLWLLTLGGRIKPLYTNRLGRSAISLITIAAMWGYAYLTGMTPSVVRAVIMVSIFEAGRIFYRQSFSINSIAAAAVLILLVRPSDLWSVSFQLSFAATAAIVIMADEMGKRVHYNSLKQLPAGRLLNWIVGILLVSLAAQLGTLPITIYYFGQVSTYFLLTNLIVLPLATLLVPCGLITIALGGSTLGLIAGKITWALAWLMNHSVAWIESLPGSTVPAHINEWMIATYYLLLVLFFLLLHQKEEKPHNFPK